ncbi:MAG: hypothetical protein M3347_09180 [Armatimonadota bacterium]|nr:hypothetical protein [Armatimonadota bacterium]
MTREQILREFDLLPYDEQLELAKAIEERLHRSEKGTSNAAEEDFDPSAVDRLRGIIKWNGPPPTDETPEERQARRRATLEQLHGILRGDGPPPSDEDIEKMRDEYLTEKYG